MEGKTNSAHNPSAAGGAQLILIYGGNGNVNDGQTTRTFNCPSTITPIAYVIELAVANQAQYGRSYAGTNVCRNFVQVGTTQRVGMGMGGYGAGYQAVNFGASVIATRTYITLNRSGYSTDNFSVCNIYAVC